MRTLESSSKAAARVVQTREQPFRAAKSGVVQQREERPTRKKERSVMAGGRAVSGDSSRKEEEAVGPEMQRIREELEEARAVARAEQAARAQAEQRLQAIEAQMLALQQNFQQLLQQPQQRMQQLPAVDVEQQRVAGSRASVPPGFNPVQEQAPVDVACSVPACFQSFSSRSLVPFKEEAETLERFSGEDETCPVGRWIGKVEELSRQCEWSQHATCIAAKRALVGAAKD